MSAFLENFEAEILFWVWAFSVTLMFLGCFAVLLIVIQRLLGNAYKRRFKSQEKELRVLLNEVISARSDKVVILPQTVYRSAVLSKVLLEYFRTYNGERLAALRHLVEISGMEHQLCRAANKGIPGERIRAIQVLSYLTSQESLAEIVSNLSAKRPYNRVVAARSLARRKELNYSIDVANKLSEVFPDNIKLVSELLGRFGPDIVPALEKTIQTTMNETVLTACLETLAEHLKSPTSVDLTSLIRHENENIRAAAFSVAAASGGLASSDLSRGLKDDSTSVKIRSAKLACAIKDPRVSLELCDLANDNIFWVRYWSVRALMELGDSGQDIVGAMMNGADLAGDMAREVSMEVSARG